MACADNKYQKYIYPYLLGFLNDQEREDFELHLMECPDCFQKVKDFEAASYLINYDQDIRASVIKDTPVTKPTAGIFRSIKQKISARLIPVAVMAILVVFFIMKPWRIEIVSDDIRADSQIITVTFFEDISNSALNIDRIIANLLITDLSSLDHYQVTSSHRLNDACNALDSNIIIGSESYLSSLAKSCHSEYLITGEILQTEPQIIITSRIINILDGDIIATQKITGEPDDDLFSVVDILSQMIQEDLIPVGQPKPESRHSLVEKTTNSPEAYSYYLKGIDYFNKFYAREAVNSFEQALKIDSTFAMPYFYLTFYKTGAELSDILNKAEVYSVKSMAKDRLYIQSRIAWLNRDFSGTFTHLKEAIDEFPDDKESYFYYGFYHYCLHNFDSALIYFNRSLQFDSGYKKSLNALALTYDKLDDLEKSILTINKYIKTAPDEPKPYDTRGIIYRNHNRIEDAIASFEKAVELKPDFSSSLHALARMTLYLNRFDETEKHVAQMSNCEEFYYRIVGSLGKANISLYRGQFKQALIDIERALQSKNPVNNKDEELFIKAAGNFMKARIYGELKQIDSALQAFETFEKYYTAVYPDDRANFRFYQAELYAMSGDYEKAVRAADELHDILEAANWPLHDYWYTLASIELYKNNPDQALAYFDKAGCTRDTLHTHYRLGEAYFMAGQLGLAVRHFERKLWVFSDWNSFNGIWDVKRHYYLGLAYEESQWYDKAIEEYEYFVNTWKDADIDFAEVAEARKRLNRLKSTPLTDYH